MMRALKQASVFRKELAMRREVGVWIDRNKTVIVTMLDDKAEIREIRSNVLKQINLMTGKNPVIPNLSTKSTAENMVDRRYQKQLNGYYDAVVSMLRSADEILIFGPGEAKTQLNKRLERAGLSASIETADSMTDNQIVAKVKLHYQ
jgi:stalled ribosome rescue protein Dom34